MFVIAAALLGAVFGAMQARRRKGTRFDMAQYAAVYALLFGVVGIFVTVYIARQG